MTHEEQEHYAERAKLDELRYLEEWEAWLRQRFIGEVRPDQWPRKPDHPKSGHRIFTE